MEIRGLMSAEKRYPLILYREWMRPFPLPITAILVILLVLLAAARTGLLPDRIQGPVSAETPLLAAAAAITFLLLMIVLILPRMAYVQCRAEDLLLQVGLLRLIVSYSRVRTSHSVRHAQIHSPKEQPPSRRKLALRMSLKQCVAVELTSYPMAFFLLRTLTHPFLFLGDEPGFLFAVEDWMGLDREVDEKHAALLAKKKEAGKQPRLGALS
jgi:hypothetical protein